MGVVYRALDRERDVEVALKTLRHVEPGTILQLKREFRALADLSHPNLVALHELVSVGQQWFFTMEIVEGGDILEFVRGEDDSRRADTLHSVVDAVPEAVTGDVAAPLDEGGLIRLRASLRQLVEGVAFLHGHGTLHRDIKPSNILVDPDGRIVLLDFGLVTDLTADALRADDDDGSVVGTVAYMAPEQASSSPLSEASDWYGVGAILYEALAGRVPFFGRSLQVLMDKQQYDPPPPRQLVPSVPEDLDALCSALLRRRAEQRPRAKEVLRRVGSASAEKMRGDSSWSRSRGSTFVGRDAHLDALTRALAETERGESVTVCVHGSSGMGKSALVRNFLEQAARDDAVVLAGRCYEHESVPFKALDAVVDALSVHLARLPRGDAEPLMPPDMSALARAFPVLRRVESVAKATEVVVDTPNPHELRRRASAALRELLSRLARRGPLIVHIDDLQWGDADSAVLLTDLLMPPESPPLLLVASFRDDDVDGNPLLRTLMQSQRGLGSIGDVRDVEVGPLDAAATRELALALLRSEGEDARSRAGEIAREAAGNPYFVGELVRYLQVGDWDPDQQLTLDAVLTARWQSLPERARRLLEVIAVAARPIDQAVVAQASEAGGDLRSELALLRTGHLVRTRSLRERDVVECYHDRIRETVVANLGAEDLARAHRHLALELERSGYADPEALVVHFGGAGEPARAARYAAAAADHAFDALAFDRAADLYRLTLSMRRDLTDAQARKLRTKLGDALSNAGRGAEAADVYLEAAVGAPSGDALELERRAAQQLLFSGRMDEGLAVMRDVLASVGMKLPASPRWALATLLASRLRVRVRGLEFHRRDLTQIAPETLTRVDVCWSVSAGLGFIDPIRAAVFQSKHLLMALGVGEPMRVSLALSQEAIYVSTSGGHTRKRALALLDRSRTLSDEIDDPAAQGLVEFGAAWVDYMQGRWRGAREHADRAEAILRSSPKGMAWQLGNTELCVVCSCFHLGETQELPRRVPALIKEAEERGDLYQATVLRHGTSNVTWLIVDDPDGARQRIAEAQQQWAREGYSVQHYDHMYALGHVDLYCGEPAAAWQRLTEGWPALRKSLMLTVQMLRFEALQLRARAALALAATEPASSARRAKLLRTAERDANKIAKEREPWSTPWAQLVLAGVAHAHGNRDAAADLLRTAADNFAGVDMFMYHQLCRRRLGELLGGSEGAQLVTTANDALRARAIANPDAIARTFAPGF